MARLRSRAATDPTDRRLLRPGRDDWLARHQHHHHHSHRPLQAWYITPTGFAHRIAPSMSQKRMTAGSKPIRFGVFVESTCRLFYSHRALTAVCSHYTPTIIILVLLSPLSHHPLRPCDAVVCRRHRSYPWVALHGKTEVTSLARPDRLGCCRRHSERDPLKFHNAVSVSRVKAYGSD